MKIKILIQQKKNNKTALIRASEKVHFGIVKYLVEHGADLRDSQRKIGIQIISSSYYH